VTAATNWAAAELSPSTMTRNAGMGLQSGHAISGGWNRAQPFPPRSRSETRQEMVRRWADPKADPPCTN
jgi:hypothetical protein